MHVFCSLIVGKRGGGAGHMVISHIPMHYPTPFFYVRPSPHNGISRVLEKQIA